MMVNDFLANLNANGEQLINLQNQLSTGKKLLKPSDDPLALSRALTLKAASSRNDQYLRNISSTTDWLASTDSALSQMEDVLTQAHNVALQGVSDTMDAAGRAALAQQVNSLLEEFVQEANSTSGGGEYLFAGQQVTTTPFAVTRDSSGQITSVTYSGDSGQIDVNVDDGTNVAINVPGNQVIAGQAPIQTAVSALISLRNWLNGDTTASASADQFSSSLDGFTSLRAIVGAKTQRLNSTQSVLTDQSTNLASMLSQAQDANVAEVMVKLTTAQNVYQASLSAGANIMQKSLLDYLS